VAFIGTGIMGSAIAGHILDAGYRLVVNTRTKAKADALVARGAAWADSVADAVRDADVVFTMVGYPDDVEDVYLSTDGLLRATRPGTWLIDLTTSSPQLARDIHDAAEVEDKHAFDCPVTGGEQGALDGTLTLIAGISERDAAPVIPLLQAFSSRICWFDRAGAGQVAKLCNQICLAASLAGATEALALAEQAGLAPQAVAEMVGAGMGGSAQLQRVASRALDGDYAPGFLAEHLRKDLALAQECADDLQLSLPETDTSFSLVDMLCRVGGGRLGTQALSLLYAEEAEGVAAGIDWSALGEEEVASQPSPARQRYFINTPNR
jgi:3-hydroxyisobutyrate dehydrogenase